MTLRETNAGFRLASCKLYPVDTDSDTSKSGELLAGGASLQEMCTPLKGCTQASCKQAHDPAEATFDEALHAAVRVVAAAYLPGFLEWLRGSDDRLADRAPFELWLPITDAESDLARAVRSEDWTAGLDVIERWRLAWLKALDQAPRLSRRWSSSPSSRGMVQVTRPIPAASPPPADRRDAQLRAPPAHAEQIAIETTDHPRMEDR